MCSQLTFLQVSNFASRQNNSQTRVLRRHVLSWFRFIDSLCKGWPKKVSRNVLSKSSKGSKSALVASWALLAVWFQFLNFFWVKGNFLLNYHLKALVVCCISYIGIIINRDKDPVMNHDKDPIIRILPKMQRSQHNKTPNSCGLETEPAFPLTLFFFLAWKKWTPRKRQQFFFMPQKSQLKKPGSPDHVFF